MLFITRILKIHFQTEYIELNVSISGKLSDQMKTNLIIPEDKFL